MDEAVSYIAGLDLGQASDHTTLVICEKQTTAEGPQYDVRYLERYKLGTTYPTVVERVCDLLQQEPLSLAVPLVIDGTGVGRAVCDLFRGRVLHRVPVTITYAGGVEWTDGFWHVPKRDLVGVAQVLLQSGRLRFAEGLPLTRILVKELLAFEVRISEAGRDTYGVWREGQHDDLVLALALACWYGSRGQWTPISLYASRPSYNRFATENDNENIDEWGQAWGNRRGGG